MAYIREYPPNHLTPKKQNLYLRRRNSKSGIIIALAGLKTSTDNADRLLNASLSSGRPHNVRVCQLLFSVVLIFSSAISPRCSVHKSLKTKENSQRARTPCSFLGLFFTTEAKANNQSVNTENSLSSDAIFFV